MNGLFKTPAGDLRWGWKAVILILGAVIIGLSLSSVLMIVLTVGYASQGLVQEQAMENANTTASSFGAQVVLSVLQLGFMLCLVRWLITRVEKQPFDWSKLGLTQISDRSRHLSLGAWLAVILSSSVIGAGLIAGTLKYLGSGFELFGPFQLITTLLLAAALAFASGFGEETVFRGYLQSCLAKRYNSTAAVLIVAVLFALSHPISDVRNPLLYLATAVLVGILFGTIFARTGSLWMGIALHILWNYLQIAVAAIRNGADERFFGAPLFVFDTISGIPQMLVELVVISAGLFLIFWLTKPVTGRDARFYELT
jgi:membrane protease YdiL (CAAX protease family)